MADSRSRSFAWILDHPRAAWGLVAALTALALLGLTKDLAPLRSRHQGVGALDQTLAELQGDFELDLGQALLVVRGESLFTPEAGAWLADLRVRLAAHEWVARTISLADLPDFRGGVVPHPLLPAADAAAEDWEEARERARQHPLARGLLLSEDGRTQLVPILMVGRFSYLSDLALATELRKIVAARAPPAGVQAELTGRGPLFLDHRLAFDRDHERLRFSAFALVAVLALLLFRNLPAAVIAGGAPALGLVWTFGLLSWLGESPSGLTKVVAPVLLMMVGFTDAVHLMLAMRRARAEGLDRRAASRQVVSALGGACLLTSVTTAIGFASLMIADAEILIGFGLACSVGALMTFLAVVLVVPLACASPLGRSIGHAPPAGGVVSRTLTAATRRLAPAARPIALFSVGITVVLAVVALGLRPNDRLAGDLPVDSPAGRGLAWAQAGFGGVLPLQVRVRWRDGSIEDLETELERIEELLRVEPLVTAISSARNLHAAFPPATRALIPAPVRRAWLREDLGQALIHFRLPDRGTAELRPLLDRLTLAFEEHAAPALEVELVGQAMVDTAWHERVTGDLARSLALAAGILFLVLTVALRSVRHGLLTLVPNTFPLVATAGVLRLSGTSLSFEAVTALVIALGIAVDDTVHLMTRYRRERRAGLGMQAALERTVDRVGAAMVLSTVVMVSGFAVVLTSELPATANFGALACGTIGAALLGDLVFLPALLLATERD